MKKSNKTVHSDNKPTEVTIRDLYLKKMKCLDKLQGRYLDKLRYLGTKFGWHYPLTKTLFDMVECSQSYVKHLEDDGSNNQCPAVTKRGPGRPKKVIEPVVVKRGPGRPKKVIEPVAIKRGPGRPKKVIEPVAVKRGPGRPRKA